MSLDSNTPRYLYRESLCPYNCSALLGSRGEHLCETIIYSHWNKPDYLGGGGRVIIIVHMQV